jgi:sterol desaturase/sphingolipid hydroxylase (fatty acid hydroxylase superfamily)
VRYVQGLPNSSGVSRSPSWLTPFTRRLPLAAILGILGITVYGTVVAFQDGGVFVLTEMWAGWKDVVLNPWLIGFLVVLGLLQWAFPARRDNHSWSAGGAGDFLWFLWSPIEDVTITAAFLVALGVMVDALFHGQPANLVPTIGVTGVAILAFVLGDFLAWASHIMHHRLATLWEFHKVHHSQRSMNMLTDNREHFVETVINAAFIFVPARLLGLDTVAAGTLAFLSNYLQAMNHANIRTNLGPLRFILVSPQHHRVHHSLEREHYNINYGSVISTWDYLFGTRLHNKSVYPRVGVNDESFPVEKSINPFSLLGTWCRQIAYPFTVIAARATGHIPAHNAGRAADPRWLMSRLTPAEVVPDLEVRWRSPA